MRPEVHPRVRRAQDLVATVFGLGYAPIAPGTFGSLPGLAFGWSLWKVGGTPLVAAGLIFVVIVGVWAADRAEDRFGNRDPGPIVVDEVAGQMLTLLSIMPTARVMLAGFLLFRLLDILKPYPANRLEALPGGAGIMADDLAAGIYANLVLQAAVHFLPGVMGSR